MRRTVSQKCVRALLWACFLLLIFPVHVFASSLDSIDQDPFKQGIARFSRSQLLNSYPGLFTARHLQTDRLLTSPPELYRIRIKLDDPTYATYTHAENPYNKRLISIFQVDDSPKTVYDLMFPYLKGGTTAGGYTSAGIKSTDGCGNELHWTISVACFVQNDQADELLAPGSPYITWSELAQVTANGPGLQRGFDYDNHAFGGLPALQKDRYQQIFLNNQAAFQNLGFHPEALVVPDVQIGYRFGAHEMGMDVISQAGVEPLKDGMNPLGENASSAEVYAAVTKPYFFRRNHWQETNNPALVDEHKEYVLTAFNKSQQRPGIYNWFSHGPGEMGTNNFAYYREVIDYMRALAGDNVIGMSLSQYLGYQKTRYAAENGALKSSVLTPDGYLEISFDMSGLQNIVRNRLISLLVNSDARIQSVTWSSNIKALTFNPNTGLVNIQLEEAAGLDPASLPSRPIITASSVRIEESEPRVVNFSVNRPINQSDVQAYVIQGNEVQSVSEVPGSNGTAWKLTCKDPFLSTDAVTLTYRAEQGNAIDRSNGTRMLTYYRLPVANFSKVTAEQTEALSISVIRDMDNVQLATFNTIAELKSYLSSTNLNSNISVQFNEAKTYSLNEKWLLNYSNGPNTFSIKAKPGLPGRPVIDAAGQTSDIFRVAMNHVRLEGLTLISGKYTSDGAAFGDNYSGAIISQVANTSDVHYKDLILERGLRGIRIGAGNGTDPANISNIRIEKLILKDLTGIAIQVGINNHSPADPEIRPDQYYNISKITIRDIIMRDTRNKAEIGNSGMAYHGQIQCRGIRDLVLQNIDSYQNQKQPLYITNSKNVLIDKFRAGEFSLNTGSGYKAAIHVESTDGIRIQNSFTQGAFENVYIHGSRAIKLYHNTFDSQQSDSRTVSLHNVSAVLDIKANVFIAKGHASWTSCLGGSFFRSAGYVPSMDTDFVSERYNLFVTSAHILDFSGMGPENKTLAVRTTFDPSFASYRSEFDRGQGSVFSSKDGLSIIELAGVYGYLGAASAGRNMVPSLIDTLLNDAAGHPRSYPADVGAFDRVNDAPPAVLDASRSLLLPVVGSIDADGLSTQKITVQLKDAQGNNIDPDGADVKFQLLSGQGHLSTVIDEGGGSYTAVLSSSAQPGEARITASVNGQPISENGTIRTSVINFLPSSNALLQNLTISNGDLSPAFASTVFEYSIFLSSEQSSLAIYPILQHTGAVIRINDVNIQNGMTGAALQVKVGDEIRIEVKAADSVSAKTYSILVRKAAPIFPSRESFMTNTAENIQLGGSPKAAFLTAGTLDAASAGYLRLTDNQANQSGFARSTLQFPATNGLNVQFEYYTYGGSGGDGLTFFLYDPSANPFSIGALGGSLGYAQTTNNGGSAGLSKAFLGVGFDEYGNFSNSNAGRQGGVGFRPSSVTLRGDGHGAAADPQNYEFLTHMQTTDQQTMSVAGAGAPFHIAGMVNGRTGTRPIGGLTPTDNGYRKARIEMVPKSTGPGYLLNVWITEGTADGGNVHHVIQDHSYIAHTDPSLLSYGFVSSTGGSNNFHEIRNLEVLVPAQTALPPNTALTGLKNIRENTELQFNATDFFIPGSVSSLFQDPNGDDLSKIKLLSLPASGRMLLAGVPLSPGQEIPVTEIRNLKFIPATDFIGELSFMWSGADPGGLFADAGSEYRIGVQASDPPRPSSKQSALSISVAELPADGTGTSTLRIVSRDRTGAPFNSGGALVAFERVSGDAQISGITDHGDGTYTATISAGKTPGTNVFVALMNGQPLMNGSSDTAKVMLRLIPSTDASLKALNISAHSLQPNFSPDVLSYQLQVDAEVSSVILSLTKGNDEAAVKIGNTAFSGTELNLDLAVGLNRITIEVKAQDGVNLRVYEILIDRPVPLFPHRRSFADVNSSGMVFGGSPVSAQLTATTFDNPGKGFLRLTSNAGNQMGYARDTTLFPSKDGLSIEFEYYTYGGNGGDGLSFFLYDPSAEPFSPGAFGGSLGYAQSTNGGGTAGLSKGFIAFGLDEFGNFSNPTAGRQGGIGERSSSLTLRGDGNGKETLATNYEYLGSVQTTNSAAMATAGGGSLFHIAGKVNPRSPEGGMVPTQAGFRKLRVDLIPDGSSSFLIDAWITEGSANGAISHKLFSGLRYTPTEAIPEFLSYGFAASTGGMNNIHEVRNLEIRLPEAAPPQPAILYDIHKTLSQGQTLSFSKEDFTGAFVSPSNASLQKIRIMSLPANGRLRLNSQDLASGVEIPVSLIKDLFFEPGNGFIGETGFIWTGSDHVQYASGSAELTILVKPFESSTLPYFESFAGSSAPGLILGGSQPAMLTAAQGIDPEGAGYLRLTSNIANQLGFARNSTPFQFKDGLEIEFDYYSYGGSGGDGMTFFLYDASANANFNIGAPGGSLGYAQNSGQPGLSKAYIGFGFDQFGNFSTSSAGRQGGPGQKPNSLTLRGDGNGLGGGSPYGSNYEFLTSVQTIDAISMVNSGGAFSLSGNTNGRSFGAAGLNSAQAGYRKARIILSPNATATGYLVNVWITEGAASGGLIHHIIRDLNYTGNTLPEYISYGFAASTGGVNNYHEVRNLRMKSPDPFVSDQLMTIREDAHGGMPSLSSLVQHLNNDLSVSGSFLDPTDLISPNNDGRNDTWVIRNIDLYPNYRVKIFDRKGLILFDQTNYQNNWGATFNGKALPTDIYYFIIENEQRQSVFKGYINVIR